MSTSPLAVLATSIVQALYHESQAEQWGVSLETFGATLAAGLRKRFGETPPSPRDVEAFLRTLHLQDLALAIACRDGHDAAWEHFVRTVRPSLYAAARAITRDDSGRELADSLYAELFGVNERQGERQSLLAYYHGRARLTTWLRTVLAQRYVDRFRAASRTVPLDDESPVEAPSAAPAQHQPYHERDVARVQQALTSAVAGLEPRDQLRLRLYYGQDVTLARIGRLLDEHEATVSRKLDRTRRHLRQTIENTLAEMHGLSRDAVADCLRTAIGAPELDLSQVLGDPEEATSPPSRR